MGGAQARRDQGSAGHSPRSPAGSVCQEARSQQSETPLRKRPFYHLFLHQHPRGVTGRVRGRKSPGLALSTLPDSCCGHNSTSPVTMLQLQAQDLPVSWPRSLTTPSPSAAGRPSVPVPRATPSSGEPVSPMALAPLPAPSHRHQSGEVRPGGYSSNLSTNR